MMRVGQAFSVPSRIADGAQIETLSARGQALPGKDALR
jgi:hypothetical protein